MKILLIMGSFILINLLCDGFAILLLLLFSIANGSIFKGVKYAIKNLVNYSQKRILLLSFLLMTASILISTIIAYCLFASFTNNPILWTSIICLINILSLIIKMYYGYQSLKTPS